MIVITTPSGQIGSQVLSRVVAEGAPVRVIARDPSKLPPTIREAVEVIEGTHGDADVVMRAFEGADAVFWLPVGDARAPSPEAAYVDFARPACRALAAQGVGRVVGVSALGRGWPREAGNITATLRLDDMIAATGVGYRALACGPLMENLLRQAASIRDRGVFYWPTPGDFAMPHVATRDVAAVAAGLLLDRTWSGVESLPMMGPEDLSFDDMAAVMSGVLRKPVAFQAISMDDLRAMMLRGGASEGMAQSVVDMATAGNEGVNHLVPRSSAVQTPTGFRVWCETVLKPAVEG